MLTEQEAGLIGFNACINFIGRDFVAAHRDTAVFLCGDSALEGAVACYVGCDSEQLPEPPSDYIELDGDDAKKYPYWAWCDVMLADGQVRNLSGVKAPPDLV